MTNAVAGVGMILLAIILFRRLNYAMDHHVHPLIVGGYAVGSFACIIIAFVLLVVAFT